MKKKSFLMTAVATLGLTAATMAQNVPNYVPTNGLVGWWPFNGNANDESGNGNNGIVTGATLTSDRYGNNNSAYSFSGPSTFMEFGNLLPSGDQTIIFWINTFSDSRNQHVITKRVDCLTAGNPHFEIVVRPNNNTIGGGWGGPGGAYFPNYAFVPNAWNQIIFMTNQDSGYFYINGILKSSILYGGGSNSVTLRASNNYCTFGSPDWFNGFLDDIGIWNRALTQQEITDLYNAVNCADNTTISPATNNLNTGSTAIFTASTSDPNPSFVWQSDFGQGYVTLNNFGNYSGTNTGTLNIANVQLPNHTQPIRLITTSGNCVDTSNVAIISIADTCINTFTDTTLITVTDTLLINTTITGLNPPNNANTIKVFPNPTNDHITIDYGNFSVMNGYQLKIENSLGQQVFQTSITQQSDYLNLTTWGGNGLYFVHIIDPQGNTIDIRKIVLQ